MAFSDRLRAAGAALAALAAFYFGVLALAWILAALFLPATWTGGVYGLGAASVPTVVAALAVCGFLVWRGACRWETLGWRGVDHGVRWFGRGVGVGLVMAGLTVTLAVVGGSARIELTGESLARYLTGILRVGGVLLVAALAEELVFRGYPLARLARAAGRVGAGLALAVAFAALHLMNPGVTLLGIVNIGLAALVLSAAFFSGGGLPLAWGVHFGWNGGLALGADAPVSGLAFRVPLLEFVSGGPSWFTGGSFGPEGGFATTVVMLAALGWFVRAAAGDGGRAGAPAVEGA